MRVHHVIIIIMMLIVMQVYEGIILELRTELERMALAQHDMTQKLENALQRAARVEQLEEEVTMYRDAAKMTALESQRCDDKPLMLKLMRMMLMKFFHEQ